MWEQSGKDTVSGWGESQSKAHLCPQVREHNLYVRSNTHAVVNWAERRVKLQHRTYMSEPCCSAIHFGITRRHNRLALASKPRKVHVHVQHECHRALFGSRWWVRQPQVRSWLKLQGMNPSGGDATPHPEQLLLLATIRALWLCSRCTSFWCHIQCRPAGTSTWPNLCDGEF